MNTVEPETHLLALATVLIVAFFLAILFAGAVLFKRTVKVEEDTPDSDTSEVDTTFYPDTGEDLYR